MHATQKQIDYLKRLYCDVGSYAFPMWDLWCVNMNHLENLDRTYASEIISCLASFKALPGTTAEKCYAMRGAAGVYELLRLLVKVSDRVFERRAAKL